MASLAEMLQIRMQGGQVELGGNGSKTGVGSGLEDGIGRWTRQRLIGGEKLALRSKQSFNFSKFNGHRELNIRSLNLLAFNPSSNMFSPKALLIGASKAV